MRTPLTILTCLMLFAATPVAAGDFEDGVAAIEAADFKKAFRLFKPFAEQGVEKARENKGIRWIESQVCKQDRRRPILLTNDNDRRLTPRTWGDPNESMEALSDLLNASLRLAFWNVEKYPSKQSLAWRIEYCGK